MTICIIIIINNIQTHQPRSQYHRSIKMIIKINIIIIIIIGSLRNHGEGSSENVFQTLSHLLTSLSLSNTGETRC